MALSLISKVLVSWKEKNGVQKSHLAKLLKLTIYIYTDMHIIL